MTAVSPLESLMDSTLKNIKNMVDVNTIIGDPVVAGEVTIIPVSRVAFGFGSGGSTFGGNLKKEEAKDENFGGGAGGGVSISPVAFLVVSGGSVKLINIDQTSPFDRLVDMAPDVLEKIISKFDKKKDDVEVEIKEL